MKFAGSGGVTGFAVLSIASMAITSIASADGFVCRGSNTGISLAVYNHTNPREGTRTPAMMIVADPSKSTDQTIARFTSQNHTVSYGGYGTYLGKVDLRYAESSNADAQVASTRLGDLTSINLNVKFSYDSGTTVLARVTDELPGTIQYVKRTGETLEEKANCERYLKGEDLRAQWQIAFPQSPIESTATTD